MPPYESCRRVGARGPGTPVADDLSARGLNLPSVTWIGKADVQRVRTSLGE